MKGRAETQRSLPTGTVTFLRTDVEGSMRLARELGSSWDAVNAAHMEILREAVDRRGGVCVRTEGDAMFAVFPEATAAVLAAIDGQRALIDHPWPEGVEVRVRMGLHSGEGHLAGDDYGGFDVNRAARVGAVGHGGQIVISGPTQGLVASSLPPDIGLRDLGRHALKDVAAPEQLFQVDVPGRRAEFPALRVASPRLGNLPDRLTSFVGRSEELDQLRTLMDDHRLVTLTGPGGIGKTSLAIEVARDRAASTPDGAWLVPLESFSDPASIGSAIARSLGLFDGVERPAVDALPAFLAERSILLVLDNFEHIMAAAGDVASLLRASPRSRFVVTSRSALRVGGEQEFPVRPLTHAGSSAGGSDAATARVSDAAQELFVDRARAALPGWQLGDDAPVVAEICTLLDGLPLGIELAAARLSLLPPTAIRDRLATRLPLPGSGPRDGPARQRTLEAAIGWSHDLLTPEEKRAFETLAVFEGGFDLQQAEAVVGPGAPGDADHTLEALISLAEHSLISREFVPAGDASHLMANGIRFAMLKTVQSFALQRAKDHEVEADARRRHAAAFRDLAEAAA
ncbi:MAG: AAA family ATPase, partial [Chloroflexota bacterium]